MTIKTVQKPRRIRRGRGVARWRLFDGDGFGGRGRRGFARFARFAWGRIRPYVRIEILNEFAHIRTDAAKERARGFLRVEVAVDGGFGGVRGVGGDVDVENGFCGGGRFAGHFESFRVRSRTH